MCRIVPALLVAAAFAVAAGPATLAQDAPGSRFEVTSIKPNRSGEEQMVIGTPPGGGLAATNVTPKFLIRFAFDVEDALIVGAPDWTTSERYDVRAIAAENGAPGAVRERVRTLLAERFALRTHREQREVPVYALTPTRRPCNFGPNVRNADRACSATDPVATRPAPPAALVDGRSLPCGVRLAFGHISGGAVTVADVARVLSRFTDRTVVDQTGLASSVDLVLNFAPEAARLSPAGVEPSAVAGGVSVFTAVQEQLGLKLEATRSPVEVLVIEAMDRPTPD